MADESPTPEELADAQRAREARESARADASDLAAEEHAAARRADKAAYLEEKLREQQAADAEHADP